MFCRYKQSDLKKINTIIMDIYAVWSECMRRLVPPRARSRRQTESISASFNARFVFAGLNC